MKLNHKYIYQLFVAIIAFFMLSSCEKQLELTPSNVLLKEDALKTPEDMQKLLNSCYDALANAHNGEYQIISDLLSDDLDEPYSRPEFRMEVYNRSTNIFNSDLGALYNRLYIPVYRVNTMDLYYDLIPGLSESEITRMKAEGSFIRALCHFQVAKLWSRPWGYTSDNSHLGIPIKRNTESLTTQRSTVAETYQYILSQLDYAIANLPVTNNGYATVDAAKALKAMVYFQMNDFANARPLLDDIINSGTYILSDSVDRFRGNTSSISSEFIFSFVSLNALTDNRGGNFIGTYRDNAAVPGIGITRELYNLINADTTDIRRNLVKAFNIGQSNEYFTCSKFNDDYFAAPLITLTQLLLTRAEIAAETGDVNTASDDINEIIARAYPGNANKLTSPGLGASNLLVVIREERRKELFAEGDRTDYLKRACAYGNRSQVISYPTTIRSAPWDCGGLYVQFPDAERIDGFVINEEGGCQ